MRDLGLTIRMITASTVLALVYGVIAVFLFAAGGLIFPIIGVPLLIIIQYLVYVQLPLWTYETTEITADTYPELHRRADALAESMNIATPTMYLIEADELNALALGRRGNGKVFFTSKMTHSLSDSEIEPVMAHEFAHLKNRDVIVTSLGTSIAQLFYSVSLIGFFIISLDSDRPWLVRTVGVVVSVIIQLFILIFVRAISRYREYVADEDAVLYTQQYDGMIRALSKIKNERKHQSESALSTGQEALSFLSTTDSILAPLFATHPAPEKRIRRVKSLKEEQKTDRIPEDSILAEEPDYSDEQFTGQEELCETLRTFDPHDFEHLVADLWESIGWDVTVTPKGNDQGIDIVVTTTDPVPQKQLIQAKCYDENTLVTSTDIQQYASLYLQQEDVDAVIVVTTSYFTNQAQSLADSLNIKLIDADDLCYLLKEQDLVNIVARKM